MDKEQVAFEQQTLSDFKKWSATALKTFNIHHKSFQYTPYNIIMTNYNDRIRLL